MHGCSLELPSDIPWYVLYWPSTDGSYSYIHGKHAVLVKLMIDKVMTDKV